ASSQAGARFSLSHRSLDQCVVGDSGSLRPIVLWLCPVGDLSASLFPNVALRNSPDRPIPPSEAVLFFRPGHAIIALRKLPQLFATGWIGKAIGQRSAFLSAGVPALRTSGMIPARER